MGIFSRVKKRYKSYSKKVRDKSKARVESQKKSVSKIKTSLKRPVKTPTVTTTKTPKVTEHKRTGSFAPVTPPKTPTISGSKGTGTVKFTPSATKKEIETYGQAGAKGTVGWAGSKGNRYKIFRNQSGKIVATLKNSKYTFSQTGTVTTGKGKDRKTFTITQQTPTSDLELSTRGQYKPFLSAIGEEAKLYIPPKPTKKGWRTLTASERAKEQKIIEKGVIVSPGLWDTRRKKAPTWSAKLGISMLERQQNIITSSRELHKLTDGKIGLSEEDYNKRLTASDKSKFIEGTVLTAGALIPTGRVIQYSSILAKRGALKFGTSKIGKTIARSFGKKDLAGTAIKTVGITELAGGTILTGQAGIRAYKEEDPLPILDVAFIAKGYNLGSNKAIKTALSQTLKIPEPVSYVPDIPSGLTKQAKFITELPSGVQTMKFTSYKFKAGSDLAKIFQIERKIPTYQSGYRISSPKFKEYLTHQPKRTDITQELILSKDFIGLKPKVTEYPSLDTISWKKTPFRTIKDVYTTKYYGGKTKTETIIGDWEIPKEIFNIKRLRYGQPFVGGVRQSTTALTGRGQQKFLFKPYQGKGGGILSRYRVKRGEVDLKIFGEKRRPKQTFMDLIKTDRGELIQIVGGKKAPKYTQPKTNKQIAKINQEVFGIGLTTPKINFNTKTMTIPKPSKLIGRTKTMTETISRQRDLLMPTQSLKDLSIPKISQKFISPFALSFKTPQMLKLDTSLKTQLKTPDILKTPPTVRIPPFSTIIPPEIPPFVPPIPPIIPFGFGGGYGGKSTIRPKKGKKVGGRFMRSFTANVLGLKAPKKRKYKRRYTGLELRI